MRKLNIYYVVSTIALAFMMLILVRTLKITGWFEKHGQISQAEKVRQLVRGDFELVTADSLSGQITRTLKVSQIDSLGHDWLTVRLDRLAILQLKVSDFEDNQVLVELFELDSSGRGQRLQGCELLIINEESGSWTGSTVGEFCGLSANGQSYYSIHLRMGTEIKIEIETRKIDDQAVLQKATYLIKRSDHDE